jgi:rod shape-determining protein MreD
MKGVRLLMALAAVVVALVVQVTLFPHVAWHGIVPNLCLLVVVGAALTRGPQFAALLGFAAGVVLGVETMIDK